jgi:hypothetical protein
MISIIETGLFSCLSEDRGLLHLSVFLSACVPALTHTAMGTHTHPPTASHCKKNPLSINIFTDNTMMDENNCNSFK